MPKTKSPQILKCESPSSHFHQREWASRPSLNIVIIGELYCYVNRDGSRMIEFANNWRDAAFQIPDVRNLLSDTSAAALSATPGPGKAINGFTAPRIVVYKLQIIYLK